MADYCEHLFLLCLSFSLSLSLSNVTVPSVAIWKTRFCFIFYRRAVLNDIGLVIPQSLATNAVSTDIFPLCISYH